MGDHEDYKAHISHAFSHVSTTYDRIGPRFFSTIGSKLVEFAEIPKGAGVLDVACGKGAVFVPASKAVSPTGQIVGIDISAGMFEQAVNEVALQSLGNVKILQMDAEKLDFPDSCFDFVLCGLCLFFFPDLDGALAGFLRVLKPGGWLVASTFQKYEDANTKRWAELNISYEKYLKPVPTAETIEFESREEITRVLSQAGFLAIEIMAWDENFYYRDEEEWWETAWSHGYRFFLERMEPDILYRYKEQAMELIRSEKTRRGIPESIHLFYTKARKNL